MISAVEREIILIKLSNNENLSDLQNTLETYGVKSAIIRGFGKIKVLESENKIIDAGDSIIEGIVSDLNGKPLIELYCHTSNFTGKIKNFVAEDLILTVKRFLEIKFISRLNERGETQMTIGSEKARLQNAPKNENNTAKEGSES